MSVIKPGTVIDDRYEIVGRLGQGGMGVVYEAKQLGLDRPVAIKMLLPELSSREEDRVRFQREARVMSRLRHEHAVEVFDYGETDERLYLVMERLSGDTLQSRMVAGTPYDLADTLRIAWELADVLVAAHQLSLVHRDMKPANVMLETRPDGSERSVVVDFGLAFMQTKEASLARLTSAGLVSGTPQYMAPEQARGADDIGPPADIYALGGIIFELATGQTVFSAARRIDLINQHLYVDPPSMRTIPTGAELPTALDELVDRMLAKSPYERPIAEDVRTRLGEIIIGAVPRGRGRPDKLNEPRSRRVITDRATPAQPTLDGPVALTTQRYSPGEAAPSSEPEVHVGLVGEASMKRQIALNASHLICTPIERAPGCDIVLVMAGSAMPADLRVPVIVEIADDAPIERVTELLRAGVTDVVRESDDGTVLVRKVRRALRSQARKGKS